MSTVANTPNDESVGSNAPADNLSRFSVHPERGFLPAIDPIERLPNDFALWEEIGVYLPKLLATQQLQPILDRLPALDVATLDSRQLSRAMLLLSFFGHGYVWENWRETGRTRIPSGVAVPWYQVARKLGRPPVLSYASYALDNWRRIDSRKPIELGNVALLQNFLGGLDEEWFVAIHIAIEAKAGPALVAIRDLQRAVAAVDATGILCHLQTMQSALEGMVAVLLRMPENCDPYIYYNRVRPYIHGFSEHPVVYQGVSAYNSEPQRFFGETGAQSTIIPAFDAALGVEHSDDNLRTYLVKMRDYMPPGHRSFLETIEAGPSIRDFLQSAASTPRIRDLYNECVELVHLFRSKHLEYAASYIQKQSQRGSFNSTLYGTGGTPFMKYLKKHRDETVQHTLTSG